MIPDESAGSSTGANPSSGSARQRPPGRGSRLPRFRGRRGGRGTDRRNRPAAEPARNTEERVESAEARAVVESGRLDTVAHEGAEAAGGESESPQADVREEVASAEVVPPPSP